jgi:hypothetical protein
MRTINQMAAAGFTHQTYLVTHPEKQIVLHVFAPGELVNNIEPVLAVSHSFTPEADWMAETMLAYQKASDVLDRWEAEAAEMNS